MNASSASVGRPDFRTLLQGQADALRPWTQPGHLRATAMNVAVIFLGAGLYGAAMGWWREPLQGFYVAIKFPLVTLLTTLGNALLNAMLAPLLGLNINFRQSLLAILMSFAIAAAILGAFSPLTAFVVWNAPAMTPDVKSTLTYGVIKLLHVAVIAFAGIAGTVRLFQLLTQLGGSQAVARRVVFAWLAGNLFLGSQLTWIARPFIGSPQLPVVFLRDTAFQGNFYENIFQTLQHFLQPD